MILDSQNSRRLTFLRLFCAVQIISAFYVWLRFTQTGYLPAPFVYDKSDTFMDLFHPMFWSNNPGVYTTWGSVYPPINFLLLQPIKWLISSGRQFADAFELRAEAGRYPIWLFAGYMAMPFVMLRSRLWRVFSTQEIIPIYLAMVFASPMLFTLERGNLILLVLPFLALSLSAGGTLCCIAIAILINIKPYFAVLIFTLLLVRRSEYAFIVAIAAGSIFLISGILLDSNFMLFLSNVVSFSQDEALFSARELLSLPSSVSNYAQVLRVFQAQGGSTSLAGLDLRLLPSMVELVKWTVLAGAFGALWCARDVPLRIVIVVSIAIISNLGSFVGGYSIIFYLPLIPVLMKMRYRRFYLGVVLLMFAPLDLIRLLTQDIGIQDIYLSGRTETVNWDLALGVLVRPPLNLSMLAALTWEIFERYLPARRAGMAERGSSEPLARGA